MRPKKVGVVLYASDGAFIDFAVDKEKGLPRAGGAGRVEKLKDAQATASR